MLTEAAIAGYVDIVKLLVESDADVNIARKQVRVQGVTVKGYGSGVKGLGLRFRVSALGFRVQRFAPLGSGVQGFRGSGV